MDAVVAARGIGGGAAASLAIRGRRWPCSSSPTRISVEFAQTGLHRGPLHHAPPPHPGRRVRPGRQCRRPSAQGSAGGRGCCAMQGGGAHQGGRDRQVARRDARRRARPPHRPQLLQGKRHRRRCGDFPGDSQEAAALFLFSDADRAGGGMRHLSCDPAAVPRSLLSLKRIRWRRLGCSALLCPMQPEVAEHQVAGRARGGVGAALSWRESAAAPLLPSDGAC
ncbi:unnamed protein product [Urochloa humidicola]